MGAGIAESEGACLTISTDDKRDFQQRGFVKLIAVHAISRQRAVPETGEHQWVGGLTLWEVEFRHGEFQIADLRLQIEIIC